MLAYTQFTRNPYVSTDNWPGFDGHWNYLWTHYSQKEVKIKSYFYNSYKMPLIIIRRASIINNIKKAKKYVWDDLWLFLLQLCILASRSHIIHIFFSLDTVRVMNVVKSVHRCKITFKWHISKSRCNSTRRRSHTVRGFWVAHWWRHQKWTVLLKFERRQTFGGSFQTNLPSIFTGKHKM